MNTSGWQRHEQRRDLPPAMRQSNITVLNHLGIAGMIASRQNLRGPKERDDLVQGAHIGVIRGCERFDPQRGVKSLTFLSRAANGQVLHFCWDLTAQSGFPGGCGTLTSKVRSCSNNSSKLVSHPCQLLNWPTPSTSQFSAGRRPVAARKRNGWCQSAPSMNRHPVRATTIRRNAGSTMHCIC